MTAGAAVAQIKELLAGPVTRGICRNADPEQVVTSSTIATSGRVYWMRLREGGKISACRIAVVTASGNLCIAYAKNVGFGRSAAPGAVVASTGSFVCPGAAETNISGGSNGDHEQTLSATVRVAAGDWVGIAADNSAVALRCTTAAGAADTVLAAGTAYRETIISESPKIPTNRGALTPSIGKNWLITAL